MQVAVLVTTVLLVVSSIGLGLVALHLHPKNHLVRIFLLASFSVFITSSSYYFALLSANTLEALWYYRIMFVGLALVPVSFMHFYCCYLFAEVRYIRLLVVAYALLAALSLQVLFTDYILVTTRLVQSFGFIPVFSPTLLTILYLGYYIFFTACAFVILGRSYYRTDGLRRHQIHYFIAAHMIGSVGSVINIVTSIFGLPHYGQLIIWLYPIIVAYGVFIYRRS